MQCYASLNPSNQNTYIQWGGAKFWSKSCSNFNICVYIQWRLLKLWECSGSPEPSPIYLARESNLTGTLYVVGIQQNLHVNRHSNIDKTKVLMTNGCLMKVKSIGAFCNTFDLHYAIIVLKTNFLFFFESGFFSQVLLYLAWASKSHGYIVGILIVRIS